MRWLLPCVVLLAAVAARGVDAEAVLSGKVVAVPDGGSVWVFLEQARASYHIALAEIPTPPPDQPGDQAARDWLCRAVLGHEVQVVVQRLCNEGETPGQVFLNGQSVNRQIACLLLWGGPVPATPVGLVPAMPVYESQPRLLLGLCSTLRSLLTGREGHFRFVQDSDGSR